MGEDGFKKQPVGAGPYKFVSFNPGIELVMEAFEGYWRKVPSSGPLDSRGDGDLSDQRREPDG